MKKYFKWIIFFLAIISFIILSILVLSKNDIFLDSFVYNYISKFINNSLTNVLKIITYIGSAPVVILITILVLVFFNTG